MQRSKPTMHLPDTWITEKNLPSWPTHQKFGTVTGIPRSSRRTTTKTQAPRTLGRRSILECDVNPYELMAAAATNAWPPRRLSSTVNNVAAVARDPGVTLVGGRRIRVRPALPQQPPPPPFPPPATPQQHLVVSNGNENNTNSSGNYRSILKKTVSPERNIKVNRQQHNTTQSKRNVQHKKGSRFYIPTPSRKKVQFLVDNSNDSDYDGSASEQDTPSLEYQTSTPIVSEPPSDTLMSELAGSDPERLDGTKVKKSIVKTKAKTNCRPSELPPPPPQSSVTNLKSDVSENVPNPPPRKRSGTKMNVNEVIDVVTKHVEDTNTEEVVPKTPTTVPMITTNSTKVLSSNTTQSKENCNKTIVKVGAPEIVTQISPIVRIEIKNNYSDVDVQSNFSIESTLPQRKTSILIGGDDCYSTVNVNDDVPIYLSSVVVGEPEIPTPQLEKTSKSGHTTIYLSPESPKEPTEHSVNPLNDPVEAVRRNLVPHVCGKADVSRTTTDTEPIESQPYESVASDCYTDHSNRSSVTEEELASTAGRATFYELLAQAAAAIDPCSSEGEDHFYESIRTNGGDPIYEEIEVPPPLPSNPPPPVVIDDLQLDKEYTTRSIFEGASKYDILSYLVEAKERGVVQEDGYGYVSKEGTYNTNGIAASDSGEEPDIRPHKTAEIERHDSGVGSESSKSSLGRYRKRSDEDDDALNINSFCEDCDCQIEEEKTHLNDKTSTTLCRKCFKRRAERKEIILELVETEEKYGRDLQIVLEEFQRPMLVAGLLTADQLAAVFLNAEELLENSQALAEKLREAVETARRRGDEDLLTVDVGHLFGEAASASSTLAAFETYCVRQAGAALLLAGLERDKELLRIFLRVSQMENALLRRMDLNSFLMVPVQRVTKYPLLLARLHKATPAHRAGARDRLRKAQRQVEECLARMNAAAAAAAPSAARLWRRLGGGRRSSSADRVDAASIRLRKLAVDALEWGHDEARFALEGRLLFTQPGDGWRRTAGRTIKLTPAAALLVVLPTNRATKSKTTPPVEDGLAFPRRSLGGGVRDAALLLVRDKAGRQTLLRDPLFLDRCVVAADPAFAAYFEVHELNTRDTYVFKAEDDDQTSAWYRQLQFYAQGMGTWRKRRNALANIMINGMGLRT